MPGPYCVVLSDKGAIPGVRQIVDAVISDSSTSLVSPSAPFTLADVGKAIVIVGAAAGDKLRTEIVAYTSDTEVVLADPATASVSDVGASWGFDCGAALQAALDDIAAAGGGTILVDDAYFLFSPVSEDYGETASAVEIRGLGSNSVLYVACPSSEIAISISNSLRLLATRVNFLGTPLERNDAMRTLSFEASIVEINRCGFYGLSAFDNAGGAIVYASNSSLTLFGNRFHGCTAGGALDCSVVENRNWLYFVAEGNRFIDYGYFNGEYLSKSGFGQPLAWIRLGELGTTAEPEEVIGTYSAWFVGNMMDENAFRGIFALPGTGQRIGRVHIENHHANVPTPSGGIGVYLAHTDSVVIAESSFTWGEALRDSIHLSYCTDVLVDRVTVTLAPRGFHADHCTTVILRDSPDLDELSVTDTTNFTRVSNRRGGLMPFTKAGTISDADFELPPPIGTIAVDTAGGTLGFKTQASGGWNRLAPLDPELSAIAGLTSAADRLPYFTGSGTAALATFTAAGRALVDDASAADQRTTLGLGSLATQAANNVAITGGTVSVSTMATTGNVGIGLTSPLTRFDVKGNGYQISGNFWANVRLIDEVPARGLYFGYDSTVVGSGVVASNAGPLAFWTYNGSAWAERMRLSGSGNLGIGTNSPQAPLHVSGEARVGSLRIDATPATSSATATHKVPVNLGGTTYYLLLSNV